MYQIDNSSVAPLLPASTSPGTVGFFTDGNPATGTPPTIVPAEFLNMIMLEVLGVLSAAGVTPSKSNFTQLVTAIRAVNKQSTILADTGTAGVYSAVNVPALTALPASGFVQRINIAHLNPGASTYAPDGLAPKPIYGLGLQPLQGGELPVGIAVLMYLVQAGVNGGNGAWIIIESLGGASQIAPATQGQHAAQLQQIGHGQCRLSVASTTSLKLAPYNGNNLIINGVPQQIPAAGVSLSNSGLTASTFYYIYALMSAGVMTLEASATTHITGTNGVEIKSGDATRTLVGAVYTSVATQFVLSSSFGGILNWFNRQCLPLAQAATTTAFSNTGTLAEITSTARLQFICWADDSPMVNISGTMNLSAAATVAFDLYVNGVINRITQSGSSGTSGQNTNAYVGGNIAITEGTLQTTSMFASTTAGTITAAFSNFATYRG